MFLLYLFDVSPVSWEPVRWLGTPYWSCFPCQGRVFPSLLRPSSRGDRRRIRTEPSRVGSDRVKGQIPSSTDDRGPVPRTLHVPRPPILDTGVSPRPKVPHTRYRPSRYEKGIDNGLSDPSFLYFFLLETEDFRTKGSRASRPFPGGRCLYKRKERTTRRGDWGPGSRRPEDPCVTVYTGVRRSENGEDTEHSEENPTRDRAFLRALFTV